jgi:hypothetical protein
MKKFSQINEYYDANSSSLSEQELMEMANVGPKTTGIDNVVIWVGPNPGQHWKRIKISNIPNRIDDKDLFVLTIPDFKIIGNVNTKFITSKIMEQIKKWVVDHMQAIIDYSDKKLLTDDFIEALKKKSNE